MFAGPGISGIGPASNTTTEPFSLYSDDRTEINTDLSQVFFYNFPCSSSLLALGSQLMSIAFLEAIAACEKYSIYCSSLLVSLSTSPFLFLPGLSGHQSSTVQIRRRSHVKMNPCPIENTHLVFYCWIFLCFQLQSIMLTNNLK